MTANERRVLEVLAAARHRGSDWQAPMHISKACGWLPPKVSPWAWSLLRKLRDRGLVVWRAPCEYSITDKGVAELEGTP